MTASGDALSPCQSMHSWPVISPLSRLCIFTPLTIRHIAAGVVYQFPMSLCLVHCQPALRSVSGTYLYNIFTQLFSHIHASYMYVRRHRCSLDAICDSSRRTHQGNRVVMLNASKTGLGGHQARTTILLSHLRHSPCFLSGTWSDCICPRLESVH